jgi:predicted MPP superfamily phosphohydrolase
MKLLVPILFFLSFLAIYFGANAYIYVRGLQALPVYGSIRTTYIVVFIVLSLLYILSALGERFLPSWAITLTQWIGSAWFIALIYLFLIVLSFDLIRLADNHFHFLPDVVILNKSRSKMFAFMLSISIVAILFVIGYIKFNLPKTTTLNLNIEKKVENRKSLNILMVSDIHLGYLINKNYLKKYVTRINSFKPDIILIAGDIMDRSFKPIREQKMGDELSRLSAPLGVYAVTGNHDFMSNPDTLCAYLEKHGIKMLRDTMVTVDSFLQVAGRDDRQNHNRLPLSQIIANKNNKLPLILIDHQPANLQEAEDNGVDLQLSGHTHNGQVWPLEYIVNQIYELGYGYKQKGSTHYYVSSGLGIWGPLFRIGTHSEFVNIKLNFISK